MNILKKYAPVIVSVLCVGVFIILGLSGVFGDNTSEQSSFEQSAYSSDDPHTETTAAETAAATETTVTEAADTSETTPAPTETYESTTSAVSSATTADFTATAEESGTEAGTVTTYAESSAPAQENYSSFCSFEINCGTILKNKDKFNKDKLYLVPEDGVILHLSSTGFNDSESVYDLLKRLCTENGITVDTVFSPASDSVYIKGIGGIYEKDAGLSSGWMYKVNDILPMTDCSQYKLKEGDKVEFIYTCSYGDI